ncbi:MAG TPA: c-type cytochrome [Trueperaceae bacterium]
MSHDHKGNPVATYVITALILGIITFFEYAIVEFEISWLSDAATIFWLVAMSLAKFVMVVAIFMHLKDDEKTYTGFFSSGMVLALATFFILPLLFTVTTWPRPVLAESQPHVEEAHGQAEALPSEQSELIESDGYSRSAAAQLDVPRPKDRSLAVEPPPAQEPQATLAQAGEGEQAEDQNGGEPAEEPAAEPQAEAQQAEGQQAGEQHAGEQAQEPAEQAAAPAEFDRQLGDTTYTSICAGCHGAQGAGMPGVFPPLAGNLPAIYNAGGREYLIDVVVHGLTGPITVDGQTYNGAMPAWAGSLSNEQIAAVLSHELTSWGNEEQLQEFTPITPDEVEQSRGSDPGNLNERRAELMGE